MSPTPDDSARVRLRPLDTDGETAIELVVDEVPVRHGRFADGTYFVYDNAYVWSDDLVELGRQLVDDRRHGRVSDPTQPEGGQ